MPTPEEIKSIAREYVNANWISESEAYYEGKRQIGIDDVLPIFMWISQRYCIVEKSKLAEKVKNTKWMKDHGRAFEAEVREDLIADLFGTALFNEEKE